MDIHEAKIKIDSKEDILLIDIRDKPFYDQGHIKGAIQSSEELVAEILRNEDKGKIIICYCHKGNSSQSAKDFFEEKGFKSVFSLDGGFEEWKLAYPVEA